VSREKMGGIQNTRKGGFTRQKETWRRQKRTDETSNFIYRGTRNEGKRDPKSNCSNKRRREILRRQVDNRSSQVWDYAFRPAAPEPLNGASTRVDGIEGTTSPREKGKGKCRKGRQSQVGKWVVSIP